MNRQFPFLQGKWYQGYFPTKRGLRKYPRIFRVSGLPLRHFVFHTDALMNWGDGSPECADLALSILWNYYAGGSIPTHTYLIEVEGRQVLVTKRSEQAFRLYKTFLREVVSRWPADRPWMYTEQELKKWLERQKECLGE